jgi:hypothetical protein
VQNGDDFHVLHGVINTDGVHGTTNGPQRRSGSDGEYNNNNNNNNSETERVGVALKLFVRTREVVGSNLSRDTSNPE